MIEEAELVIGSGDHDCVVYPLTREQLRQLAMASVQFALTWGDWSET